MCTGTVHRAALCNQRLRRALRNGHPPILRHMSVIVTHLQVSNQCRYCCCRWQAHQDVESAHLPVRQTYPGTMREWIEEAVH